MAELLPSLPPILAAIAEVAGIEAALKVAAAYGGRRVTVPTLADGNNWLTALVGAETARAIILELGAARRIDVPLGPEGGSYLAIRRARSRRIAELEAKNSSAAEIAQALGITERAVRFRRAERRRKTERGQGSLFD